MHPYERMNCGHFARYEFVGESGEPLCVMCELERKHRTLEAVKVEVVQWTEAGREALEGFDLLHDLLLRGCPPGALDLHSSKVYQKLQKLLGIRGKAA